jgi:hypothetical protein
LIREINFKKSCKDHKKRIFEEKIKLEWNKFLDRNKDIKRDEKLDKILD